MMTRLCCCLNAYGIFIVLYYPIFCLLIYLLPKIFLFCFLYLKRTFVYFLQTGNWFIMFRRGRKARFINVFICLETFKECFLYFHIIFHNIIQKGVDFYGNKKCLSTSENPYSRNSKLILIILVPNTKFPGNTFNEIPLLAKYKIYGWCGFYCGWKSELFSYYCPNIRKM